MSPIDSAIKACGSVVALAEKVGVAASAPHMWKARGRVPSEHCPAVERAAYPNTSVEQLRPDVRWVRVQDPDWPHPSGRPCIDVAAPAAQ